jgi:biopolymer transport protein ExbD
MYTAPSSKRKKRFFTPLNLIPILDVVFILIFFLLASSQLLRTFEIGSDLPIYKFTEEIPKDESEFQLRVVISNDKIILQNTKKKENLSIIEVTSWDKPEIFLEELNQKIIAIKNNYPGESRVLIKASKKINYQSLIFVLDKIRSEDKAKSRKLFSQLIFES